MYVEVSLFLLHKIETFFILQGISTFLVYTKHNEVTLTVFVLKLLVSVFLLTYPSNHVKVVLLLTVIFYFIQKYIKYDFWSKKRVPFRALFVKSSAQCPKRPKCRYGVLSRFVLLRSRLYT